MPDKVPDKVQKLTRSEFLKKVWCPYPPCHEESSLTCWMGVRDFLKLSELKHSNTEGNHGKSVIPGSAWVCGRFTNGIAELASIESDGLELRLSITPQTKWLESSIVCKCEFDLSQIQAGDWLAVLVSTTFNNSALRRVCEIEQIVLLAATDDSSDGKSEQETKSSPSFTANRARQWMQFLATVRAHFVAQDFIEAQTPTLVPSPGTEPYLDPFVTQWDFGSTSHQFYLPTSPEFHLKRLLARGWTKIFEFKTCFRNGEISPHHQPEFQMLEWYRALRGLDSIAQDVEELFASLAIDFKLQIPRLRRTSMRELFFEAFGFSLTPSTSRKELARLASVHSIRVEENDSWDDIFFRLFLEHIEGDLGKAGPILVRGYPPSQAALSRIGADGFADRFEVYWKGMELANAFHELNDPVENEARFRQDAELKKQLGKTAVSVDEALIRDLYRGMPPAGGIALGLDRLFMAMFDIQEIANARAFAIRLKDSI